MGVSMRCVPYRADWTFACGWCTGGLITIPGLSTFSFVHGIVVGAFVFVLAAAPALSREWRPAQASPQAQPVVEPAAGEVRCQGRWKWQVPLRVAHMLWFARTRAVADASEGIIFACSDWAVQVLGHLLLGPPYGQH